MAVASAGPYASLHLAPDRNHTSTPQLSFLQAGCPSCRPTNKVKALTLKAAVTNNIYSTIATSILEYMLTTVTCCEKIAKKLFEHFLWNRGERTHIFWRLRPHHVIRHLHHCLANSTTFQVLEILQTQLHDWNPVLILKQQNQFGKTSGRLQSSNYTSQSI